MSAEPTAEEVWKGLLRFVFDNRDTWRHAVVEVSGLPFSRVRIVRRLKRSPLTVKQVADYAMMDAPAATVAVNDLESRGLVVREIDPSNRRSKLVSLTEAGRAVLADIDAVEDPAPAELVALSGDDLVALRRILDRLSSG
ncbi:MarR family transcriptional regulator [Mycobacterium sp. MS1601]|uniref:MarR family winged helix-turn-helix transcriptional regulator n=1 Tax=Mycobacterium sp. MS1601 TaxID=1936029 RepID=UPI00097972C3|nr:MarR family transcriptional regulator [Mycobacterium sp. MS1601]AQA02294.1 MarR family transcriptional regulator [Mycobacterium sp. MS1601]